MEEPAPTGVTKLRPATRQRPAVETPAPPPAKVSAGADGGVRRIAFRLDPALHAALTARAAGAMTSHGQVVLVEATYQAGVLTDLVVAEATPTQTDGLFPRLKSRTTAQAGVPVEIRLHARAATVLDQLVDQTGADSRTQLVVAALRHQLARLAPAVPDPLTVVRLSHHTVCGSGGGLMYAKTLVPGPPFDIPSLMATTDEPDVLLPQLTACGWGRFGGPTPPAPVGHG